MANEFVAQIDASRLLPLNGSPTAYMDTLSVSGSVLGRRLLKSDSQGFSFLHPINAEHTMGTGLTLQLGVVDDGADSNDLGKVVRLGVTVKLITSGSDTLAIGTAAGTEQTVDVTLDATTGEIVLGSLAIANANLDSAAVGNLILVRVRRLGTASQDTCTGTPILTHVYVRNT
jgi:hypothetical protein